MRRSYEPPVHRFEIDHGTNNAPPPPRRQSNGQELAPAYLWNSTTQELIPILSEDHPNYRENQEIVTAAIRRWNAGNQKPAKSWPGCERWRIVGE